MDLAPLGGVKRPRLRKDVKLSRYRFVKACELEDSRVYPPVNRKGRGSTSRASRGSSFDPGGLPFKGSHKHKQQQEEECKQKHSRS